MENIPTMLSKVTNALSDLWAWVKQKAGCMQKIDDLVWDYEKRILTLKKRYFYIKAILDELTKITGGREFKIRNSILWQMLSDSYSMLIIDMASLYRSMAEQGGFFNQLKNHSAKLRRTSYRKIEAPSPNIIEDTSSPLDDQSRNQIERELKEHFQKLVASNMEEQLVFLFPQLKGNPDKSISHKEIDDLKNRIMKRADEVLNDRDNLRAHRYQQGDEDKAKMAGLSLKQVGEHFEYLEGFMNAVRMVTLSGSMTYTDTNNANTERTAQDVADIIAMGSINQVCNEYKIPDALKKAGGAPYYYVVREEFYKANPAPFGVDPNPEKQST